MDGLLAVPQQIYFIVEQASWLLLKIVPDASSTKPNHKYLFLSLVLLVVGAIDPLLPFGIYFR